MSATLGPKLDWRDGMVNKAHDLWLKGSPVNEIARQCGVTKNQVVGVAHRRGWPGRPSPIKRRAEGEAPKPSISRDRPRVTLPPVAPEDPNTVTEKAIALLQQGHSVPEVARQTGLSRHKAEAMRDSSGLAPTFGRPTAPPPPVQAPKPVLRYVQEGCCWPLGTPGTKSFRYCDDERELGRPYCPQHCSLGYIRKPKDKEDSTESFAAD